MASRLQGVMKNIITLYLDIMMPKRTGCRWPKIFASTTPGHSDYFPDGQKLKGRVLERFNIGADDYITKTFTWRSLSSALKQSYDGFSGQQVSGRCNYKFGNFL
jgi:DNA-binding response OmpR family regulator